jgi:nucleoside-diphosphate-sugar epimerase
VNLSVFLYKGDRNFSNRKLAGSCMSSSSSYKIVLLGGSGFIGTKLAADLWHAGHYVSIGDIRPSAAYPDFWHNADVRDLSSMKPLCHGYDVIINLAAAHRDDVRPLSLYAETNVHGAEMVCKAAEDANIHTIIFTSSVAVYGHQPGEPDEDTPHHPINEYGRTKSEAEAVYLAWQKKDPGNRTLVMVRPAVVFGPRNRGNVHILMDQIRKNRFLMIGSGANKKSMAYIDNVSAFLVHCLNFGPGVHIFNYADKPDFSMNELVSQIRTRLGKGSGVGPRLPYALGILAGTVFDVLARLTGKTFPISRIRIEKFCASTVFSAKLVSETAFVPPKKLQDALSETIEEEFTSPLSGERSGEGA